MAHRSFCLQFAILAEERDFENGWKWKEFKLSRARDLDLYLRSGHTAYRRASLNDLYLYTKFHSNWRNFLWTDGRTDVFPLRLLGRLLEVDLIICNWFHVVGWISDVKLWLKQFLICNLYWTLAEVPDFAGWGGEEGKGGEAPGKIAEYPRA